MGEVTLFLLTLIGILIPANGLLWWSKKRNQVPQQAFKSPFYDERPRIQQAGLAVETNHLKSQLEGTLSRIIALEEVVIKLQNNATKTGELSTKPSHGTRKEKTERIKILEEYLKN